jgi:hypothetical protein
MPDHKVSSGSKEYIFADVGNAPQDPTSFPVKVAIIPVGTKPVTGDFVTADWDPESTYAARLMIGPGSTFGELEVGSYLVYTRIDGSVEDPELKARNTLVIF